MKKFFLGAFMALLTLPSMAVEQQIYTEPQPNWPDAFDWVMKRYDYCPDEDGVEQLIHVQEARVVWDPMATTTITVKENNQNVTKTVYGKLTVYGVYQTECTQIERCDIVFNNKGNMNFKWSDDGTTCQYSFTSKYWSQCKTTAPYTSYAKYATHKYAYVANASYNDATTCTWWETGKPSKFNHQGNSADFTIDLETRTIAADHTWGAFMRQSTSGGSATLIEGFTRTHLNIPDFKDIVPEEPSGDVTINNDLIGVTVVQEYDSDGQFVRNVLYAKDANEYRSRDINTDNKVDFMDRVLSRNAESYDQSNWLAITFDGIDGCLYDINNYVGHLIKGGSITGAYSGGVNPQVNVIRPPVVGAATSYAPNLYIAPSFCDAYTTSDSPYFFVQPKPQEYCRVTWATYDAATDAFYVPARSAKGDGTYHNPDDLDGGFSWNRKYLNPTMEPQDGTTYSFHAIINKVGTTASGAPALVAPKVTSGVSTRYLVLPLELNAITTGIEHVNVEPDAVTTTRYYNATGLASDTPYRGFNIVVEHHADGTTTARKELH